MPSSSSSLQVRQGGKWRLDCIKFVSDRGERRGRGSRGRQRQRRRRSKSHNQEGRGREGEVATSSPRQQSVVGAVHCPPPSLPLPVLRVRSSGLSSNEELEEDDRTNDSDVDDVEKREVFSQRFSDGVDKGEREGKRGKEGRSPPSRQRLLAFI